MSFILSQAEIATLTDRTRLDAKVKVLTDLGIPHKVEGRRIIISRVAFEASMAGGPQSLTAANETYAVDVEALRRRREHGKKARAG